MPRERAEQLKHTTRTTRSREVGVIQLGMHQREANLVNRAATASKRAYRWRCTGNTMVILDDHNNFRQWDKRKRHAKFVGCPYSVHVRRLERFILWLLVFCNHTGCCTTQVGALLDGMATLREEVTSIGTAPPDQTCRAHNGMESTALLRRHIDSEGFLPLVTHLDGIVSLLLRGEAGSEAVQRSGCQTGEAVPWECRNIGYLRLTFAVHLPTCWRKSCAEIVTVAAHLHKWHPARRHIVARRRRDSGHLLFPQSQLPNAMEECRNLQSRHNTDGVHTDVGYTRRRQPLQSGDSKAMYTRVCNLSVTMQP